MAEAVRGAEGAGVRALIMSSDSTTPHTGVLDPAVHDRMPRHRTLDGFVEAVSHAEGVGLADVDPFTTLVVQTDNSVYQITILQPYAREVYVQGGAFFPERTRACLSGSSFGGSCLKLGWVGIGLHMEFLAKDRDQWVLTSHVRSITLAPSATPQPC